MPFAAAPTARVHAADWQHADGADRALRRPALPAADRSDPPPLRRGGADAPRATSSASRNAGARRSARCSGHTRSSSCPDSPARRVVDLHVPCTFDFNVAATKYFAALERRRPAAVPAVQRHGLLRDADAPLQVAQISWSKEARYRLPVAVWTEMMAAVLPEQRLAAPAPGHVRSAARLQARARVHQLGADAGQLVPERTARVS